jgi:Mg-chelatase subunit ChlD
MKEKNLEAGGGRSFVSLSIAIVAIIIVVGVAIDLVRAHVARTRLSLVADAAAQVALRNLSHEQSDAAVAARAAFEADSRSSPAIKGVSTPDVIWSKGWPRVRVTAAATINKYFLRVADHDGPKVTVDGRAHRVPVIMSLVLDKSGSMLRNGGATALPPAVIDFMKNFVEGFDNLAEISFSSIATIDVPMTTAFQSRIKGSVERMSFYGATFAQGGLQDGYDQILTKPLTPGSVRIVVFFTDGWANTINDELSCSGSLSDKESVNFGGCAPLEAAVGWCRSPGFPGRGFSQVFFIDPQSGRMTFCRSAFTFPAQRPPGGNLPLTMINVTNEATYRTEKLAETMRANRVTIYSIGLGDKINEPSLRIIANDPAAASYNPNQPQGAAVFAPGAAQLDQVFQDLASKIQSRLSP